MGFTDSPFDKEPVGKNVYLDIINTAVDYVHIMTPYLILDDEMIFALSYAVKRGVKVVIIMPHITDKPYAYILARNYYEVLIRRGVRIYEYTPGFVHAKVFVSDDTRAVVGSINLDYRSLYLNFECAAYMYQLAAVRDVQADFLKTLESCEEVTLEDCKKYSPWKKFLGKILRFIGPLM
jgi:cardiolipin synthase